MWASTLSACCGGVEGSSTMVSGLLDVVLPPEWLSPAADTGAASFLRACKPSPYRNTATKAELAHDQGHSRRRGQAHLPPPSPSLLPPSLPFQITLLSLMLSQIRRPILPSPSMAMAPPALPCPQLRRARMGSSCSGHLAWAATLGYRENGQAADLSDESGSGCAAVLHGSRAPSLHCGDGAPTMARGSRWCSRARRTEERVMSSCLPSRCWSWKTKLTSRAHLTGSVGPSCRRGGERNKAGVAKTFHVPIRLGASVSSWRSMLHLQIR
jgi:hypothetical protein